MATVAAAGGVAWAGKGGEKPLLVDLSPPEYRATPLLLGTWKGRKGFKKEEKKVSARKEEEGRRNKKKEEGTRAVPRINSKGSRLPPPPRAPAWSRALSPTHPVASFLYTNVAR